MRLFLDTEFNGFKGPLISMALRPEEPSASPFYESLGCPDPLPWVAKHVMPFLGKSSITLEEFQEKLQGFLDQWDEVVIIADWHEDIAHFCNVLSLAPGIRIKTPSLRFEIRRDLDAAPSITPHNALSDAIALWHSAKTHVIR